MAIASSTAGHPEAGQGQPAPQRSGVRAGQPQLRRWHSHPGRTRRATRRHLPLGRVSRPRHVNSPGALIHTSLPGRLPPGEPQASLTSAATPRPRAEGRGHGTALQRRVRGRLCPVPTPAGIWSPRSEPPAGTKHAPPNALQQPQQHLKNNDVTSILLYKQAPQERRLTSRARAGKRRGHRASSRRAQGTVAGLPRKPRP